MPGTIATAYVEVLPSTQGITSNLEEAFGGAGEKAGEKGGKLAGASFVGKLGKALVAAGAVKAVTDFFKDAVKQGAEYQQNIGGTEAVFGKAAVDITSRAQQAYKNMGLSASDYMATANKMGALFQGSGLSQVESMRLTTKAMQRAADVASVMGIDTTAAMESIAGAAKGNFTMMDNLGVAMNATTLQAYALEKGINFDWNTASQAEKSQLAMEMFFDKTSQYAGNFARESEQTISGSIGMLSSSWTDFMAKLALGEDVTGAMRNVVKSVIAVGENLLPIVGNIFKGIGTLAVEGFQAAVAWLGPIAAQAWDKVKAATANAWASVKASVANAWTGIKTSVNNSVAAVGAAISNGWQSIKAGVASAWAGIQSAVSTAWDTLKGAVSWDSIVSNVSGAWSAIESAVSGAWAGIQSAVSTAWDTLKGGVSWDSIVSNVSAAWTSIESGVSGAFDSIKTAVEKAWKKVTSISFQLPDIILGALPRLPKLSITGSFSIIPPSVPRISWNAKAMDNPYLFGSATLFGAGEVGDEVLYGRAALMRDIETAVGKDDSTGRTSAMLEAIDRIDQHLDRLGIYLDRDALVGGLAAGMNEALGGLDALTQRGLA